MDTTDPAITFDADGVSNHFWHAQELIGRLVKPGASGEVELQQLAEQIREEGKDKPYDCVMGVSGGVDSSYVGVMARDLGLRPLAVHLDNGWNTDTAVSNIHSLLEKLDIDLYTHVVNWDQFRDLQRSVFLSSLPNIEAVTDHAIKALLYQTADRFGLRYVLSGSNANTEAILPEAWGYNADDSRILLAAKKRFGDPSIGIDTYPHMTFFDYFTYIYVKKIRFIPLLNYGDFNKARALDIMKQRIGYVPYARKHGESRFTRFFQEYYLPEKYGFDKRKAHLSSLIASGQMNREEALAELEKPLYDPISKMIDVEYCTRKLGFSESDWAEIMATPIAYPEDFPNNQRLIGSAVKVKGVLRKAAALTTRGKS
ncbi:putative LPS biosynthesis protein WbpG [Erythrobacter litoralis HTCC2594]|uniref:Putative LPS biosynthesis protein WbpG n=2 Tax=Erythrobacter litoralis TaxID=39960 RepID=Q2N6D3_ERYLH|nr:putative LPS biosynthesis protein WbpG [Erythrobacter litoralis HTCC2594]